MKNPKTFVVVYRHPNSDIQTFANYINKCLTKITKERKQCYLPGDFNMDLLKYDVSNKHRDFLNMVTSFGYLPYIIHPTRITENTSTVIDNIYSNNLKDEIRSGNILIQFAYHLAQFLSINRNIDRITPGDVYRRDFTNFDLSFKDDISRLEWNLNNSYGINEKFNTFLSKMENCIDLHAPIKKLNRKQIRKTSKPWINLYIIKMIPHRNKLFKRKKENLLNNKIKITYNLFRNCINMEIEKAKKAYYQEYSKNNLSNMKNTWKRITNILNLNNYKGTHVTQLNYNGKNLNNNKDMVDAFNEFFTNVGPTLDNDIPIATNRSPSLLLAPTTSCELNEIISNLDDSKSSGPSSIPTKLLKMNLQFIFYRRNFP